MIGLQVAIVVLGLQQFQDSEVEAELTQNCDCEREVLDLLDESANVSTVVESSLSCSSLNSSSAQAQVAVGAPAAAAACMCMGTCLY